MDDDVQQLQLGTSAATSEHKSHLDSRVTVEGEDSEEGEEGEQGEERSCYRKQKRLAGMLLNY